MNTRTIIAAVTATLMTVLGVAAPAQAATDPKVIDTEMRFDGWNAYTLALLAVKDAGPKDDPETVFIEAAKTAPLGVTGNVITDVSTGNYLTCIVVSRDPDSEQGTSAGWAFLSSTYLNMWLPYSSCQQATAIALTLISTYADREVRSTASDFDNHKEANGAYVLPELVHDGKYLVGYWNTSKPSYDSDGDRIPNMIFLNRTDGSSTLTEYVVSEDRMSICITISDNAVSRVWNTAKGGIQPKNVINCAGDTIPTLAKDEWIEWRMKDFFQHFNSIPKDHLTDIGNAAFEAAAEVQPVLDRNHIKRAARSLSVEQMLAYANSGEAMTSMVPIKQQDGPDKVLFDFPEAEWVDLEGVTLESFGISKNGNDFCAALSYRGQTAIAITGQGTFWGDKSPLTCTTGRFTSAIGVSGTA